MYVSHKKNYVIHENLKLQAYLHFIASGLVTCVHSRLKLMLSFAINTMSLLLINQVSFSGLTALMMDSIYKCSLWIILVLGNIAILMYWGMPSGFWKIMQRVERIPQFRNGDLEPPFLVKRELLKQSNRIERWTFQSYGIGFSEWTEPSLQEQLENALDIAILDVGYGDNNHRVVLKVIVHPGPWPDVIPWDDKYLPPELSRICVGLNRSYPVTIDLAKHPHYMIGGETGSGKTVLILSIIWQAKRKGYQIYLVDLKHFVDYSKFLSSIEKAVDDENTLLALLTEIVAEMHKRLSMMRKSGCANIEQYNMAHVDVPMPRIMLVIDEYMEAVVKTGDKEQKARGERIESLIATLCKLSRAAGISVIIGLQRGGQEISGQIRSNVRVLLGSCNDNLSIVMTGSAELGRLIPSEGIGMFVTDDRQLFKGFYGGF